MIKVDAPLVPKIKDIQLKQSRDFKISQTPKMKKLTNKNYSGIRKQHATSLRELVFNTPSNICKTQITQSPTVKDLGGLENLGIYHPDALNDRIKLPRDQYEVQALSDRNFIFLPDQHLGNQTKKMTKQQLMEAKRGEVSKIQQKMRIIRFKKQLTDLQRINKGVDRDRLTAKSHK